MLAQVITKARSSDIAVFDPERDTISAEYQGSTLIERYLDPTDRTIPDFAVTPGETPLRKYYKFRVLNENRFIP